MTATLQQAHIFGRQRGLQSSMIDRLAVIWFTLLLARHARSDGRACDAQSVGQIPTLKGFWVSFRSLLAVERFSSIVAQLRGMTARHGHVCYRSRMQTQATEGCMMPGLVQPGERTGTAGWMEEQLRSRSLRFTTRHAFLDPRIERLAPFMLACMSFLFCHTCIHALDAE